MSKAGTTVTTAKAFTTGTTTIKFPITKRVQQDDGSIIVYGLASDGSLDRDGQIVDPIWCSKKLKQWLDAWGAPLALEHDRDLPPAGKGLDIAIDPDKGESWVRARVAQKDAVAGVLDGSLVDFSVGMVDVPLYEDPKAPNGRIGAPDTDEGYIAELSLTRMGSNKNSHLVKIGKRADKSAPIVKTDVTAPISHALVDALAEAAATTHGKDTKSMPDTATKATDMPEGHVSCGSCNGSGTIKGELPCPKCEGKGHFMPKGKKSAEDKAAAKAARLAAAAEKNGDHDPDDDVGDALDDAAGAVGEAQQAQAVDDASDKGTGSAIGPPAQDGHMKPGSLPTTAGMVPKTKKDKAKLKVTVKPPDDGDGADDDADKCGKAADDLPAFLKPKKPKGKKGKTAPVIPYQLVRAHDILCPCYGNKVVKAAYGEITPEMLDPAFLQEELARQASSRKARPGSIGEVAQAYQSATGLQHLETKTFLDLARAAHKGFLSANPNLPNLRPGLISPDQFRRGYLPGANDSSSSTTHVPSPDLKQPLDPERFDRGPLTENETRPTLDNSGHSVAKSTVVKGRTFYTNQAKDDHSVMMGQLHDFIADNYPGCCPMAMPEGTATDSDGMMGRPAEMNAPLPPEGPVVDTKADSTISAVSTVGANKAAEKAARRNARVTKSLKRQVKDLRRSLKAMEAKPDPRAAANRAPAFGRPRLVKSDPERLRLAKEAKDRILSGDSREASEALDSLRAAGFSPKEIAAVSVDV